MNRQKKNILITGTPGVGKTTLVIKLAEALKDLRPVGFYTEEIREDGIRKGFELVDLGGEKRILSHCDINSRFRVGKYRVDVSGFDEYLRKSDFQKSDADLVVIDEIGKMECFSHRFINLINNLLDSDKSVLATIALKGGGVISGIKQRFDLSIYEITTRNRDSRFYEIIDIFRG